MNCIVEINDKDVECRYNLVSYCRVYWDTYPSVAAVEFARPIMKEKDMSSLKVLVKRQGSTKFWTFFVIKKTVTVDEFHAELCAENG